MYCFHAKNIVISLATQFWSMLQHEIIFYARFHDILLPIYKISWTWASEMLKKKERISWTYFAT